MAGQARFGGWHARKRRFLDGSVAVAAIDPQSTRMMFMTEHHGLGLRHVNLGDQRGPENGVQSPGRKDNQQNHTQNTRSGESIGPTVKDLWHSPLFPVTHEFS